MAALKNPETGDDMESNFYSVILFTDHMSDKKKFLLSHFVPGLQSVFYGLQSGFCSNSNAMHMNLITVMGRSTLSLFVIRLN